MKDSRSFRVSRRDLDEYSEDGDNGKGEDGVASDSSRCSLPLRGGGGFIGFRLSIALEKRGSLIVGSYNHSREAVKGKRKREK